MEQAHLDALEDDAADHRCAVCGYALTIVRPGKYQCDRCEPIEPLEDMQNCYGFSHTAATADTLPPLPAVTVADFCGCMSCWYAILGAVVVVGAAVWKMARRARGQ